MTNQPTVCTDPQIRAEVCSSCAPQRDKALERFVKGAFEYLFNSVAGYAANKKWECTKGKIREICTEAYVEFSKNTAKAGFTFQKEDACGYFFKIARNILVKNLFGEKPPIEAYDSIRHDQVSGENPQSAMERKERHDLLHLALAKLHPEDRVLLSLYADGYKTAEISQYVLDNYADISGQIRLQGFDPASQNLWTEPYTKTRLQRARQKLRDLLSPLIEDV